jgi:DNA replication and repair protein RecF
LPAELFIERIAVRGFRNLTRLDLEPSRRLNVVSGDNGQGKTSLLEAIYFVATSKSFRTERLRELVQEGMAAASVGATVREAGLAREQRAALVGGSPELAIEAKRPTRRSSYATRTPVVVFHPGDLELASGPAAGRRLLLDRVALFVEPASADHHRRYLRALRERQRILEERGLAAPDLPAFEQVASEEGAAFARSRARAAARLLEALSPAFARMAPAGLELRPSYAARGSQDASEFRAELEARRAMDLRRRAATYGPQKDDLDLDLEGRSVRHHASQGQQRMVALSLKIAELECVRSARNAEPLLLLDDVSSELDASRTGAVYELVLAERCQVFVTTTRPELFVTPSALGGERLDLRLSAGSVEEALGG